MVEIRLYDEEVSFAGSTLVEGMPGVGLVGKIATDHIIERVGMTEVGEIRGEGIPPVTVFDEGERGVNSPIRLFHDADSDMLALRADVPIHTMDLPSFDEELTAWLADHDVLPIYLSGIPAEREGDEVPNVTGVGVGEGQDRLDAEAVAPPEEAGMITGPGGALLSAAHAEDLDAVGLMVGTDPRFPDPQGAHALIKGGINPVAGTDVATERLVEEAEQIMEQRKELAQRMQQADQAESSQVSRTGMFQ